MIMLCKEGELFESGLIKSSGLKSHSYYTSILLLEESLFTLFYRMDAADDDKDFVEKRRRKIRRNLNIQ